MTCGSSENSLTHFDRVFFCSWQLFTILWGKVRAHANNHKKASTTENLHLSSSFTKHSTQTIIQHFLEPKSCFAEHPHSHSHLRLHLHFPFVHLPYSKRRLMPIWRYQFHRFQFICMRKTISHAFSHHARTNWIVKPRNAFSLNVIALFIFSAYLPFGRDGIQLI